jgi:hypothetical protein
MLEISLTQIVINNTTLEFLTKRLIDNYCGSQLPKLYIEDIVSPHYLKTGPA